jgi:hypothetical protein
MMCFYYLELININGCAGQIFNRIRHLDNKPVSTIISRANTSVLTRPTAPVNKKAGKLSPAM